LVRLKLSKIYSRRELVEVIFEQPSCRISNLVKRNIAQRQSASKYVKELVAIGVLKGIHIGKKKLFVHLKLMQVLAHDVDASL